MDEHNVEIGSIRLEEAFDEAKISEPIPFHSSSSCNKKVLDKNEFQRQGENLLPVQGTGTEYREG